MTATTSKACLKSKTIWAGLLEIVAGLFDILSGEVFVCTFYGFKAGWVLVLFGILKIVLRFKTNNNIRLK